jgi:hypothetical protein
MTVELPLLFSLPPGAPGPRDALIHAAFDSENITAEEDELVDQAEQDVAQLLTYSHEHVKRLTVPDWSMAGRSSAPSAACMRVEWTRTADMSHLGDPAAERRIHDALESFASTGYGNLYALREPEHYRLHVGDARIRFRAEARKIVVLAVVRRERPSRVSMRRPAP